MSSQFSTTPGAISQRDRYHSDPVYRKRLLGYVKAWAKRNRKKINATARKNYANLSIEDRQKRAAKVRRMRAEGLWKNK